MSSSLTPISVNVRMIEKSKYYTKVCRIKGNTTITIVKNLRETIKYACIHACDM